MTMPPEPDVPVEADMPGEPDAPAAPDPAATLPANPAALARAAMERAKASARQRGAVVRSAPRARRDRHAAREKDAASPLPYGAGREPATLSASAEALLRRMGWTENIEVASVTARWREVIGDQIADHCEPESFAEGVLVLRASSTAWATQLGLMSGQLRHRLNEEWGREVVREIQVKGPTTRSWTKGQRTVKGRGPRDTYG